MKFFAFLLLVCSWRESYAVTDEALVTETVYLDVEVEGPGSPAERIEIGLFGATSPKTVRNFVALATHEVRQLFGTGDPTYHKRFSRRMVTDTVGPSSIGLSTTS